MSIPAEIDEDAVYTELTDQFKKAYKAMIVSTELDDSTLDAGRITIKVSVNRRLSSLYSERDLVRAGKQRGIEIGVPVDVIVTKV